MRRGGTPASPSLLTPCQDTHTCTHVAHCTSEPAPPVPTRLAARPTACFDPSVMHTKPSPCTSMLFKLHDIRVSAPAAAGLREMCAPCTAVARRPQRAQPGGGAGSHVCVRPAACCRAPALRRYLAERIKAGARLGCTPLSARADNPSCPSSPARAAPPPRRPKCVAPLRKPGFVPRRYFMRVARRPPLAALARAPSLPRTPD